MRYDAEHKQRTRERVLKEAAKAIRKDGPHRLAVASVMGKAGLTHGGFYAHFKSRDDLIAAGVEQMFAEGRAKLILETAERDPAAGLTAYIDFYLSTGHRDTRTAGCPLPFLSADAPRLSGSVRERFAQGVDNLTNLLAEKLAALGHGDAQEEAGSMLAELVGAVSLARAEPDEARSAGILDRSRRTLKRRLGLEVAQ